MADERLARSPWQFKKLDGVWRRRPTNTNKPWQTLTVQQTSKDSASRKHSASRNKNKIAPPSTNRWKWE